MAFVVFGIAIALVVLVNVVGRWSRKVSAEPAAVADDAPKHNPVEPAAPPVGAALASRTASEPGSREYQPYSMVEVEELARARERAVEVISPKRSPKPAPSPAAPGPADTSLTYHMSYASEWGEVTERRISVKRVYWDHGSIYVEAYCHLRRDRRTFRADRIEDLRDAHQAYIGSAVAHFGTMLDPDEIITPGHELVMGKARAGLNALIWIARASGDLEDGDVALLLQFCEERARVGRGATDFGAGLAERWIRDARPTFDNATGGVSSMRRGGPEWKLTMDRAREIAAAGDTTKRAKRLARIFKT